MIEITAQAGDIYKYGNERYSIVRKSALIDIHPKMFGITPQWITTGCYNGFWCVYSINDGMLCLDELYVNSEDNHYPPIEGILPDRRRHWFGYRYVDYQGYHRYSDLKMRIPYTGKILVGCDFMFKYYIHMGYQKPWGYKSLVELVFKNGKLIASNDQSHIAADLRSRIDSDKEFLEYLIMRPLMCREVNPPDIVKNVWWI